MKTSLITRFGVAAAVAALTLVGTTVPAEADTASIKVTQLKLQPTATYVATDNQLAGAVAITTDADVDLTDVNVDVYVNNKLVGAGVDLFPSDASGPGGVYYQRAWGAGVVQLRNIRASGVDAVTGDFNNLAVSTPYNAVRVRYALHPSSVIKYHRVNSKLSFKAKIRYTASNGKLYSAGKAILQYKKNGKWKKLKTLKLNSAGKASYKITLSKKRVYRLVVPTTNVFLGDITEPSKKI